jgi:hypothetical protein
MIGSIGSPPVCLTGEISSHQRNSIGLCPAPRQRAIVASKKHGTYRLPGFQKSIVISGDFDSTLAQRKAFCKMFFGGLKYRKFVF